MKRRSIKFKFFAAISMVAVVFIGVLLLLNLFFYDDYALFTRRSELRSTYRTVQQVYNAGSDDINTTLDALENRGAIRLAIINEDGEVLYSPSMLRRDTPAFGGEFLPGFGMDDQSLRGVAVLGLAFRNMDTEAMRAEGCQFSTVSLHGDEQYLCLTALLTDTPATYLIAYMPHAFIENNSSFNLTFLLIAGGCALLICLGCGYVISRQFTRPLIGMADAADRMSELDFSRKCAVHSTDEIGQLGQSLNRLSAYLEQAIGELQQSNDQLAQEVRERERIDGMRREFIVNVSHELKTPIALIQGYAEGLTAGIADDPEDRKFYCETIADEADHMNKLVMQLLSLSKLELGAEQPYCDDVNLLALCRQAMQKTGVLCESRGLHVRCTPGDVIVRSDGDLLDQVVMNYLSNAIRYTMDGGSIELSAKRTETGALLSVFNEGDGLPAEELPKIWEKFYRTDRARSRENGGTGIGLSLVRAIADTLHGDCGAENVPGGIRFWFAVPDMPAPPDEDEPPALPSPGAP